MDGSHDIEKCYQVTTDVLNECYNEIEIHKINLKGTVLKPNMVIPGSEVKKFKFRRNSKNFRVLKKMFLAKFQALLFYQVGNRKLKQVKI